MKILTTKNIEIEPISVSDDLYLVYVRYEGSEDFQTRICKKFYINKLTKISNIDSFTIPYLSPKHSKGVDYRCHPNIVSNDFLDELKSTGNMNSDDSGPKLNWGDELPDDFSVVYWSWYDHTFLNLDGTYINHPDLDFYLSRDYDLEGLIDESKTNSDLVVLGDIYYVSGNGPTLNVAIHLTDEHFENLKDIRYSFDKRQYLEKNTVLGKYKRERPDDDDY